MGIYSDLFMLKNLSLIEPMKSLLTEFQQHRLLAYIDVILNSNFPSLPITKAQTLGYMGQLSCKEEAAGKIRVFALVDI